MKNDISDHEKSKGPNNIGICTNIPPKESRYQTGILDPLFSDVHPYSREKPQ